MDWFLKYTLLIIIGITASISQAQGLAFYLPLIPDSQIPHLKPDMLKGVIGMYELGTRPATVPNLLGGVCTLDSLSNDFMQMRTSRKSELTIKMIKVEKDSTYVMAVVHTVEAVGTKDSGIVFFTNTWRQLNTADYFTKPSHKDFYKENEEISYEEFEKICRPLLVSYSFVGNGITATIEPEKYLSKEDYKKIEPALKEKTIDLRINVK